MVFVLIIFLLTFLFLTKNTADTIDRVFPLYIFLLIAVPYRARFNLTYLPDLTLQRFIFLIFFYKFLKSNDHNFSFKIFNTPLIRLIIVILISSSISLLLSINFKISIMGFLSHTFEYFFLYIILYNLLTPAADITKIAEYIFVGVLLVCVFALIEYYFRWNILDLFPAIKYRFDIKDTSNVISHSRGFRLRSIFPVPHLLGAILLLGISITPFLIGYTNNTKRKLLYYTTFIIMLFVLYKTYTRGPWLTAIIIFMLLLILSTSNVRKPLAILSSLILFTFVLRQGIFNTLGRIFVQSFESGTQLGGSFEYRFALFDVIKDALSVSSLRTIFGFGQSTFYYLRLEGNLFGKSQTFLSCDSSWLSFLISLGYSGFILMITLFILLYTRIFKSIRILDNHQKDFLVSLFSYLIGFGFLMTNVAVYGWAQFGYIFWSITALTFAITKQDSVRLEVFNNGG